MPIRRISSSFRSKVVLVAVLLVAIQLGTVFPLLHSLHGEQRGQAEVRIELAGAAFAEYMQNRTTGLINNAAVLAKDLGLRDATVRGQDDGIADALRNLATRNELEDRAVFFEDAAIFDLSGSFRGGIGAAGDLFDGDAMAQFAGDPGTEEPLSSIQFVGGTPYQTVSMPIREQLAAYEAIAWLTIGFPVNARFASEVAMLTGYDASFVRFGVGRTERYASTLEDTPGDSAFAGVHLGDDPGRGGAIWGEELLTLLRPVLTEDEGLYVALQVPNPEAMRPCYALRDVFLVVAGIALLATIAAAFWLSRVVTRPIGRLADAAGRMADGIYDQPIRVTSTDEFGVLAQGFNAMQEAIANRERDIVHMAHHDSLSGLPTREIVVSEIREAIDANKRLAVVNFVLHRFGEMASSLGHRTADQVIQLVAGRLRDRLEGGQVLGHLNLQEFVIVLPGAGLAEAEDCALELQTMLRSGIVVGNANISLQVRVGVALYPQHGTNASQLLHRAGVARSHATHHLGSVGVYETGQEAESLELIRIVGDFPRALQNRELRVEYQPKIDCNSLELTGAEALVRWEHPKLGQLPPDKFIGAIEQAGGISQLTRWVLEEATATLALWRSRGLSISMSVNISANDLTDHHLPRHLDHLCDRHGLEPGRLTLEVTESAIMHDVESSLAVITAIRRQGFRIAIDDFGTGHSALAQLKRLPVDELKIDKSFVLNITDRRDEAVVRTAIELAHQFGLTVVGEGVEDEASLTRLRQLGCETAQGFFFAQPLGAARFAAWAEAWASGEGADIVTLVGAGRKSRQARR